MACRSGITIVVVGVCILCVVVVFALKSSPHDNLPIPHGKITSSPIAPESHKGRVNDNDYCCGVSSTITPESRTSIGSKNVEAATKPSEARGRRQPAFVRAEDAGENFASLESSEVVRRLTQSNDRIVQRKAAKVLGDRNIAGKLSLSEGERATLDKYIEKQISLTAAATGEERTEASDQIRRLWWLTTDKLVVNLGSDNRAVVEAAAKNLALMRNASIVEKIIVRITESSDEQFKKGAILALGVMREKRDCLVPNRTTLGDEESAALASTVILPFLTKLQASEKDAEILQMIKMAFHFLEKPPDARLRSVPGDDGTAK